jgi:predicted nuclease of predicted toxin-antitoxin system
MGDPGRMKLLLDQNLSHRLVAQLAPEFPGSDHIRNLGMAASPDADVWAFAAAHDYVIVSKDADFSTVLYSTVIHRKSSGFELGTARRLRL